MALQPISPKRLKYSAYSGLAIIGACPAPSWIISGAGVYSMCSNWRISQAITKTLYAWNSIKAFGGIKPSTATAAQPISFKIRFIPYIFGMLSISKPVFSKPSK